MGRVQRSIAKSSDSWLTARRFLRARKFQQEPAYDQFTTTEKWRKDNSILELFESVDVEDYDAARRLVRRVTVLHCSSADRKPPADSQYPMWTGRRDKRGMPLYVFEIGSLDGKKVTAYEQSKSLKQVAISLAQPPDLADPRSLKHQPLSLPKC